MKKIILLLPTMLFVFEGCGQKFQSGSASTVASSLGESISCASSRSQVFDTYTKAYRSQTDLSAQSFAKALKAQTLNSPVLAIASKDVQSRYQKSLQTLNQLMTADLESTKNTVQDDLTHSADGVQEGEDDTLLHLARLEMRSQIDSSYVALNAKLDSALLEAQHVAAEAGVSCAAPETMAAAPSAAPSSALKASPLFGAHYTMATAYQSCQSLALPLVDAGTGSVEGVKKTANTIDGIGYGRIYTDVALLKKTHYYHRGQTYGAACANQDKKPLVYDYGGVPVVSSGTIDLFTNSGGGSALGIDCSAFVSTAAAVAGNLYKPSTANKGTYTRFVSRDFINPSTSGWTCYDSVKVAPNAFIQSGDIAAVQGHVVMIDEVGADPFGISNAKTVAACSSLSYKNFDFAIIQSSPSKNSLGINRFVVKDYLPGETKMQAMFLGYAKQACLSKFDKAARTPVTSAYGIIRHKQISSCLAPKIALKNESCISQCSALN